MAYIATLKKNNTVIYPQTKSTAVYEDDGVTTLDTTVVKKSTAAADANKMIKADGTKALVGASNIDFTTFGTTLWTNPNALTTDFTSQTITLSDSIANYDHVIIIWKQATTDDQMKGDIFYPNLGYGIEIGYSKGSTNRVGSREINYDSATTLSISSGYYNAAQNDAACIPYKIIGYKYPS